MLGLINPMEGKLSISNIKINEDIEIIEESYLIYLNHQSSMMN